MLIGTDGTGVSYGNLFPRLSGPDAVRNNAVVRKIPTTDHIPRAGSRDGNIGILKKALKLAMGHQFRAGLGI